jgi:aspartyl-tRNA(Asn)/glutamyl-tRNA(Gln) amidotransferase subunit A
VPGGSSGGSAAAVAAGMALYALGSDTGGSIRQPCSFCGVSGIKPTYGAVSRFGLVAYASSLDQIGPIGRTVKDCAEALSLMGGHDPLDATNARRAAFDFTDAYSGDVRGMTVGIPAEFFAEGLDEGVGAAGLEAGRTLERMGAKLVDIHLPLAEYAIPAYYVIACAEASSNLSRYDGVKYGFRAAGAEDLMETYVRTRSEGFGMEVKRRVMLGAFVLSSGYYDAYYRKAMRAREMIRDEYARALESCDMLLAPCSPTAAYKLGENIQDPLTMYLGDIYTVSVNLAGLPAVALPCGQTREGMPVGMQLIGGAFTEPTLVRAAHAYQMETDHHLKTPAKTSAKGGAPK